MNGVQSFVRGHPNGVWHEYRVRSVRVRYHAESVATEALDGKGESCYTGFYLIDGVDTSHSSGATNTIDNQEDFARGASANPRIKFITKSKITGILQPGGSQCNQMKTIPAWDLAGISYKKWAADAQFWTPMYLHNAGTDSSSTEFTYVSDAPCFMPPGAWASELIANSSGDQAGHAALTQAMVNVGRQAAKRLYFYRRPVNITTGSYGDTTISNVADNYQSMPDMLIKITIDYDIEFRRKFHTGYVGNAEGDNDMSSSLKRKMAHDIDGEETDEDLMEDEATTVFPNGELDDGSPAT